MLPNFLIIGPPKCGTTSMYHYLRQHPDVYMSSIKEPHYYWREGWPMKKAIVRSRDEYERLFDGVTAERVAGEASTHYLHSLSAPDLILEDLPGVRLIASLRNPAERAYSHYLHFLREGREFRTAEEAIVPGSQYFDNSFYAPALQRWLERFPRERMHVIVYEDFAADPLRTMRELFAFLGVDPSFAVDTATRHNTAAAPLSPGLSRLMWMTVDAVRRILPPQLRDTGIGSRMVRSTYRRADPLSDDLRRRLLDAYRHDAEATGRLLNRDLSHWFV